MHFGLPCISPHDGHWYRHWPGEIQYSTSRNRLKSRADAGCVWCRFILNLQANPLRSDQHLTITLRGAEAVRNEDSDPRRNFQWLRLEINEYRSFEGFVYTALGKPYICNPRQPPVA